MGTPARALMAASPTPAKVTPCPEPREQPPNNLIGELVETDPHCPR